MNRRQMILHTGAAVMSLGWLGRTAAAAESNSAAYPKRKVLFFSKSSGFEHDTIKRRNGQPSFVENLLSKIGPKNNIDFTFSKDGSLFSKDYLDQFDALFFYTTGDLTKAGTDKNPPMSKEGKEAFLNAIRQGKGFVGTHSASDTFHSAGASDQNNPGNVDPYIQMLGGEFVIHGAQQESHLIPIDPHFPGLEKFPDHFGPREEWYALKNFAPDLHVLLVQDTSGMNGPMYQRPPYPSTWAHPYGKGRVFYTNMGHREDVWENPVFQSVLLGGLHWATGNVQAEIPPNLDKAAPHASELPEPRRRR